MPIKKNLANIVTVTRIILSPLLLYFAFAQKTESFLVTVIILFTSDILDGVLARALKIQSEVGRKLDSYADWLYLAFYMAGFIYLFRGEIGKHGVLVLFLILYFILPKAILLVKFGKIVASHLRLEQLGGWINFLYVILLLVFDWTDFLFYAISLWVLIIATEQTLFAILIKDESESKTHSAFELFNKRKG